ncbi:hypothetical protein CK203_004560 [Vitis vinifera]|uniref:Pentatricopeptide repeat-containing protein n=1 Tax=Vitis vinifera TaxID=29760 RepID=A0A438KFP4_VITVI|nr:hypothetical protein CK203_004560 [Vitis vinifera]
MSINATSSFRPGSIPSLVWSPQASSLMPQPSVVSYNTILSGYFKFGLVSEAIKLFDGTSQRDCHSWNIVLSGPDGFTYSIVIPCCDLGFGQPVHADIVKVCSNLDAFRGTDVLRM